MKKIRVALIYGGRSKEHEVSLQSAASVMRNLDPERFEIVPIGIDPQGRWWLDKQPLLANHQTTLPLPKDSQIILNTQTNGSPHQNLIALNQNPTVYGEIDVVFPVLHGPFGEDGTLQGLLELANLPYIGSGVAASAIAMDKDIAKRLVAQAGLTVSPFLTFKQGQWQKSPKSCLEQIQKKLHLPLFVKPANLGSSIGIHKVKMLDDLSYAIDDAFQYDTKILVEQAIKGREIEVAVLENPVNGEKPLISIPGEIIPQSREFYSYEAKYLDEEGALLEIPAKLSATEIQKIQTTASQIFEALECEGMARIDFFLEDTTNQLFFNEANTIPGFTKISMYPKLWEATGIDYTQLLSYLIDLAIKRHTRRNQLR